MPRGWGFSLSSHHTEAVPGSLQLPGCCPSTAFPVPQCPSRAGAAAGRVKAIPGWICPTGPSLHWCLYPKLLCSSSQLAQGQARNNTKPHLQRAQARSNLVILVKERHRDLSQPDPALPPCALHSSGRPQVHGEGKAKSPKTRSLWFLPLPSPTATFHRQPHTPCTSVGTQQFTFTSGLNSWLSAKCNLILRGDQGSPTVGKEEGEQGCSQHPGGCSSPGFTHIPAHTHSC